MTWPMLFGTLALMSFQLVDSFFISLLGSEPLAAMGFTMPFNQLLIGVQVGIGIGTTALVSRSLGAQRQAYARRLGALLLLVGSTLMASLALILLLARQPLLQAMGADPQLFPYTDSYWRPWLLGSWCHALLYFANSLCRANGDTRMPGLMMVFTSLLNMALDPLFIFVFDWGLAGAAYATICSCLLGCIFMYFTLFKRSMLDFRLRRTETAAAIASIASVSLPAMLSQLMPGMAALLATRTVAIFGTSAIAAWALGTRLETFSIVVVLALTMALPPMLGRLLGAGDFVQAHKLVRLAVRFVVLLQLAVALFWLLLRPLLVNTLTSDAQTAEYLARYLLLVPVSYGFLGTCILTVSVCNALGMPLRALLISLLRLFAFYLPALYAGALLAGMHGVYLGVMGGNLLAGISGWLLYRKGLRKLQSSYPNRKVSPEVQTASRPS